MRWERGRYRSALYRTRGVGDETRVLLLAMLDRADAAGYVTATRKEMALELGRAEVSISRRIKDARDNGWLSVVERGRPAPNRPATWALTLGREQRVKPQKKRSPGERPSSWTRPPGGTETRSPGGTGTGPPFRTGTASPRGDRLVRTESPELRGEPVPPGENPDTGPQENRTGRRQAHRSGPVPLLAVVPDGPAKIGSNGRAGRAS